MTRRFQFSLARLIIATALLCAAAASVHQALRLDPEPIGPPGDESYAPYWGDVRYTVGLMGTAGLCCALAVGVLAGRTAWCAIGGVMVLTPCLWYLWTQPLWTSQPNATIIPIANVAAGLVVVGATIVAIVLKSLAR